MANSKRTKPKSRHTSKWRQSPKFEYESLEPKRLLATVVANYVDDFAANGGPLTTGWQYQWNAPDSNDVSTGAIDDPTTRFESLSFTGSRTTWTPDGDYNPVNDPNGAWVKLAANGGHPGVGDGHFRNGVARYSIASYTVQESGVYSIDNSFVGLNPTSSTAPTDGVEVRVFVNRETPVDVVIVDKNSTSYFDAPLGFLAAGDTIHVAFGAHGHNGYDYFTTDFDVVRQQSLEQQVGNYRDDFGTSGNWEYYWNAPEDWSSTERGKLWSNGVGDPLSYTQLKPAGQFLTADGDTNGLNSSPDYFLRLNSSGGVVGNGYTSPILQDRFAIAGFEVQHSGQYGISDSYLSVFDGSFNGIELYIHVENGPQLNQQSVFRSGETSSFDLNLGYLQKGDTVYVAFGANGNHIRDRFETDFSIVRTLPRAAPDLSVLESGNDIISVNDSHNGVAGAIPNDHLNDWQAIKSAIAAAGSGNKEIHFDKGTYNLKSIGLGQSESLFKIAHAENLVIDGNGSTLIVDEYTRPLFNTFASSNIVFKDMTIDYAERVPAAFGESNDLYRPLTFTQGKISNLDHANNTFTLTVNTNAFLAPDASFLASNSAGWGYAVDPVIDGRLKAGTEWHYATLGVSPGANSTEFTIRTHLTVGLENGDRYVMQRRHNVSMFGIYNESENVTVLDTTVYSAPSVFVGSLNSKSTNVINSHVAIRPDDWTQTDDTRRWKSINGDGVHVQSNRIGPWVENSTFNGGGDDVMNFYTTPLTIVEQFGSRQFTLASLLFSGVTSTPASLVQPGDRLSFFDPVKGETINDAVIISSTTVERPDPADPSRIVRMQTVTLDQDVTGIKIGTHSDQASYRNETTVFNNDAVQGALVQDSVLSNSRRYGNFLMASNVQLIDNLYEGLSDEAIAANNEAGWPLGSFADHVLIQGNDFLNNGFSIPFIQEEFHTGAVAFKAGRYVEPSFGGDPTDFLVDKDVYHFSNVRILDNVFYHWQKSAVSVRNAQNVTIEGNSVGETNPAIASAAQSPFDVHYSSNVELTNNANDRFAVPVNSSNVEGLEVTDARTVYNHGLLAWHKFDTSEVLTDSSGNNNRPSFNLAGISEGRFDSGAIFNSTNSVTVDLGDSDHSSQTVSFWFNAKNSDQTQRQVIFEQGDTVSGSSVYVENGELVFGTWGIGFSEFIRTSVDSQKWHHIALVIDSANLKMRGYLDGRLHAASTGQVGFGTINLGRTGNGGTRFETGISIANNNGFSGTIDDLRVYGRSLGHNEVLGLSRGA